MVRLSAEDERRLQEIRERERHALPGPWMAESWGDGSWVVVGPPRTYGERMGEGDATFIAQARDDVPWLLVLIERLTGGA